MGTTITISPCVPIILCAPLGYTDLVADPKWRLKVQLLLRNVDCSFIFILYLFWNTAINNCIAWPSYRGVIMLWDIDIVTSPMVWWQKYISKVSSARSECLGALVFSLPQLIKMTHGQDDSFIYKEKKETYGNDSNNLRTFHKSNLIICF